MSETSEATKAPEQDATRELEQAQRGVQEVLDRIKDGDEQVGPEDLEAAESRVRFARARLEGEERRKEEEAERARTDRIEALRERALALDIGHVRKLEGKARKALDTYVAAAVAYRNELNEVVQELHGLGPLPDDLSITLAPNGYSLQAGPEHRPTEWPMSVCASMAKDGLKTHIPRGAIDLERPRD
jgi:hypothetical protein